MLFGFAIVLVTVTLRMLFWSGSGTESDEFTKLDNEISIHEGLLSETVLVDDLNHLLLIGEIEYANFATVIHELGISNHTSPHS